MDYKKLYEQALQKAKDLIINESGMVRVDKALLEDIFPELKESEDEMIRKELIEFVKSRGGFKQEYIDWLEKQGEKPQRIVSAEAKEAMYDKPADKVEQKFKVKYAGSEYNVLEVKDIAGVTYYGIEDEPNHIDYVLPNNCEIVSEQKPAWNGEKLIQEIEPFEAEHGKYYYCIKDYFCGGRKQASKGDVIQALRGLPIMGLKDASEYFLPVNFIKCNSVWSEEDKKMLEYAIDMIEWYSVVDKSKSRHVSDWLKHLKERIGCEVNCTTTKEWKPSEAGN